MAVGSILIVDDEYGVRSGIRQILEMEGYQVVESETGQEALALLDAGPVDVALIDYRLPDIDGLTLLEAIKARGLDLSTCMITAYANIDTAIAATRQGIDFFLPKPFSPEDLLGVVETLVSHKRLRAEAERLRGEHEASLLALAEERTQTHTLVGCLRDAVLVVNRDGEVVLANRAMTELVDRPESEVLFGPAQELLAGGPLAALSEQLAAPAKDRTVTTLEIGDESYMASVVTFRSDDGAALGRILTLSDISEVRRLATEKARFIRTMVHEFRSPMGAVKSLIEVALDKSLGDEVDAYLPMLERAERRIDGLVELIGDLLSLSRLDAQQDAAPAELVDVAPLAAEVVELQGERMTARGITASVTLADGLPPVLVAADDLRTVLTNLVGNAIKYNRDGGSVQVTGRLDDDWVRLEVSDTGIGMLPGSLEHVFDEFFREKRRETRDLVGNGLGLAIVKRLVERTGGRLEVRSSDGEGSTFSVLLPA
jgi:two-component system phosphate regulon sensor histidine kinase PhoR